jgi:CubicO group peptidase (beta-lactamase class C family)
MSNAQARVQVLIDDLIGRDVEAGLQVAAYVNGELVVDAWSGLADSATGRLVDGETLFTVFSCTKGITATVIHLLAERGQLDYDAPVARYWPDFGRNAKEGVTVRQVLCHRAGVPQVPDSLTPDNMSDWERVCRAVADLPLLWEPGTRTGYHAVTYGWILGEVARRIDGRPFGQIVQEELCQPLAMVSLFVGIPDAVEPRVATLEVGSPLEDAPIPPDDALIWRAIPRRVQPLADWANRPDTRRACHPAGNGIMNARALARHYAALVGGAAVPQLLPAERIRIATTLQTEENDLVVGPGPRKALGYWLGGGEFSVFGSRSTAFGHGGAGGSIGLADPEHRFAFALAKTRMVDALPGEGAAYLVAKETRQALGIPE